MAVNPQIRALAGRLSKLEGEVLRRKQPGLAFSSIEDGALTAVDGDGNTTMAIGAQFDGTNTASVLAGPPPPAPSAPLVTPQTGSLRIYWDGTFADGAFAPMDFARVVAYCVPIGDFDGVDPLNQTLMVGSFVSATGGEITASLEPGVEYVVYLVTWSQAGKFSSGSDAAAETVGALVVTYKVEYAVNSSETVPPTSGWSSETPTRSPGTFVWTRTIAHSNDGTSETSAPALMTGNTGATGSQGIPGPSGSDGSSLYTWLKYADTPTTGMSDFPDGKAYIGLAYNKASSNESSSYGDYTWSLMKGEDGQDGAQGPQGPQGSQGIAGPAGADGSSLYTWLKYADTPTTGMSDLPDGKAYIGLAYNKASSNESSSYGDYTWSLVQGETGPQGPQGDTGVQGPAGADGQPTYTWIKYGTSSTGAGFSDSPTGKTHIGIAYNKTTAAESNTPGDYTWSLIKGADGAQGPQGVAGPAGADGTERFTWLKYADSPTTGMSDSPDGKAYIGLAYNKTTATESSSYGDYSWSLIKGADGEDGAQGPQGNTGVQGPPGADGQPTYTWIKYGTSASGAGFSDSPTGKTYIGLAHNKTTAAESSTPSDYTWSLIQGPQGDTGPQGSQGVPGPAGADGTERFTWLKYADTPTSGMSDSPDGKAYIGLAYNKTTATESSSYGDYSWSLIKGADGEDGAQGPQGNQGVPGPAGADGQPTYTWIKYGTSSTGAGFSDSPTGKTYIGLAHNKTTATESNTPGDYTWSLIQGPQGDTGPQGVPGPAGADGTERFTWLKYADTPTTGMSDSPTGKAYIGLAYNKTTATESSSYGDYSWSLIKGADGQDGADGAQGPQGNQGVPGPAGADGQPTYTWIKYGTSSTGAGLSDDPTGKTYIGLAYNKTTATESNTPGDYTWSLIQGPQGDTGPQGSQGVQGPTGADGQSLFTWLKYADTPTTGMSDSPDGKAYIGLAYNKTTATESSSYGDYSWSLVEGEQGVSVTSITPYYALVDAGTTAPVVPTGATPPSPWQDSEPAYLAGKDLYRTEKVAYSNGSFGYTAVALSSSYTAAQEAQRLAEEYAQSRGTDMIANGYGTHGDNLNFSWASFEPSDAPTGASGSFRSQGGSGTYATDEFLPVDPTRLMRFGYQLRETNDAVSDGRHYGLVWPFDAYKQSIAPKYVMYISGSLTTLAEPVNPGDTTITLTSSASWYGTPGKNAGAASHLRSIIWWDYVDPGGKAWPELTYSRNWDGSDFWSDGGIDGNVITLNAPYAGPARPAGTKLSNGSSGGSYMYAGGTSNVAATDTWTAYSDTVKGIVANGNAASFLTGWPHGVAYCRAGWLLNRNVSGSRMAVAAVTFSDAAAAQEVMSGLVSEYVTEYATNSSETVAPTSGWSTESPTRTPGVYIWQRVTVTRQDGSSSMTAPVLVTGNDGNQGVPGPAGADGQPTYTWIKYGTSSTGDGFSDDSTGKTHIGLAYNKTTATESNTPSDYTWSLIQGPQGDTGPQGPQGNTGVQGPPGADGQPTYTWIKYGTSSTGAGFSDSPTGKTYIGLAHNKTTAAESSTPSDYTWSLIQGPQGDTGPQGSQGVPGPAGADGSSLYTWVKYADTPTTGMSDSPTGKTYIGLAYNKTTATESSSYGDYSWSLIKGTDGSQGPQGPQGQTTYTWVKYGTSSSGAGLSDDPTGKTYIGIAYNKTTATESNTPGDYTWSLIQGPQGDTGSQGPQGNTGSQGDSVTTITPYWQYVNAGAAAPAKPTTSTPPSPWVSTEPAYATGKDLYRTDKYAFSSGSYAYTAVSKVAAFEGANYALTAANGKSKVTHSASAPGGAANAAGDTWFQHADGGLDRVVKQFRGGGGTSWTEVAFDPTIIPQIDIGSGTFGTLTGGRLAADALVGKLVATGETGARVEMSDSAQGDIRIYSGIGGASEVPGFLEYRDMGSTSTGLPRAGISIGAPNGGDGSLTVDESGVTVGGTLRYEDFDASHAPHAQIWMDTNGNTVSNNTIRYLGLTGAAWSSLRKMTGHFSVSLNEITINSPGMYLINMNVWWANSGKTAGRRLIFVDLYTKTNISLNNYSWVQVASDTKNGFNVTTYTHSLSRMVRVNSGDKLRFGLFQDCGSSMDLVGGVAGDQVKFPAGTEVELQKIA